MRRYQFLSMPKKWLILLLGALVTAFVIQASTASSSTQPRPPQFQLEPGFYEDEIQLGISNPNWSGSIYYTLDGSLPTRSSALYHGPIALKQNTVVRARIIGKAAKQSRSLSGTFFIGEELSKDLPVVSLMTDSLLLFDSLQGIYTIGHHSTVSGKWRANFMERREIPVHFEFFDPGGEQSFTQQVGMRISGNTSRGLPQKSLNLIARKRYGQSRMEYPFFPDRDLFRFKHLLLRNGGNDWNFAHFRDSFIQNWIKGRTYVDAQAGRPCITYLNGEYWGVYFLREKANARMVAQNQSIPIEKVDFFEGNLNVRNGDCSDFESLWQYITTHDLSEEEHYRFVEERLDLKSLTDYWAVEIWAQNGDWVPNNVKCWRNSQVDGKWQYLLWDLDRTLAFDGWGDQNLLEFYLSKKSEGHVQILSSLLANTSYRNYFVNRHADLYNTLFSTAPMNSSLDSLESILAPEMIRHFEKWGTGKFFPQWGAPGRNSVKRWRYHEIPKIRQFICSRSIVTRNHLQQTLELGPQQPLFLNVTPAHAGSIKVNTVSIKQFPWNGIYYQGIPVSLTACPNPGFSFAGWEGEDLNTHISTLTLNLRSPKNLTAKFSGTSASHKISISEIHFRNSDEQDPGDWVEVYNGNDASFDLSNWRIKDDQSAHRFIFPPKTTVAPHGYLILARFPDRFKALYPFVTDVLGPMNFGLDGSQDQVRLFDETMQEQIHIAYHSGIHSTNPNGLELIHPSLPPHRSTSWKPVLGRGTPGSTSPLP